MEENPIAKAVHKILVVDDDPAVRKVMRKGLEMGGFQVLEAQNGKEAVEKLAEGPDLILQDLILPDITGYDLVSKLRVRSQDRPIPILALSGYMEQPDGPWDNTLGFDALLVKPIGPSELVKIVKEWLAKSAGS